MASHAQRLDPAAPDSRESPHLDDALLSAALRIRTLPASLTSDEARVLTALAKEIVAANARQAWANDDHPLADIALVAGAALLAIGLAVMLATTLAHLAVALPLTRLAMRPALWSGALSAFAGAGVARLARATRSDSTVN